MSCIVWQNLWSLCNTFLHLSTAITPFVALSADKSVVQWACQFIFSSKHLNCTVSTLFFQRDDVFYLLCTRAWRVLLLRNTQSQLWHLGWYISTNVSLVAQCDQLGALGVSAGRRCRVVGDIVSVQLSLPVPYQSAAVHSRRPRGVWTQMTCVWFLVGFWPHRLHAGCWTGVCAPAVPMCTVKRLDRHSSSPNSSSHSVHPPCPRFLVIL